MLITNVMIADANGLTASDVREENGKICEIAENLLPHDGETVIDAEGKTLMPGFIDMHSHFRDPGFTYKETLETGSAAAAHGGYTFCNLMANTNPVCSSAEQSREVRRRAEKIGLCGVNQVVSITENFDGKTISHLETLPDDIKVISEDGKGVTDNDVMARAMKTAKEKDLLVISHAEDMTISKYDYRLAENIETARNILLAQYYGTKLHMAHVSTAESVEYVRMAKRAGANVTAEATPHHLWFSSGDYRVNPPIREEKDVKALIDGIRDGTIDCIATDHAPHTAEDKKNGAPGMVGLETAFAVCYTKLCMQNHIPLQKLSQLLSANPAKLLGLKKGVIEIGADADFTVVDTNAEWTVNPEEFKSMGKNTPFAGERLYGKVLLTVLGGKITYIDKENLKNDRS